MTKKDFIKANNGMCNSIIYLKGEKAWRVTKQIGNNEVTMTIKASYWNKVMREVRAEEDSKELVRVADQMRKEWDEFVKEHGHEPKFAHTVTKYDGDEPAMDVIKVSGFDKDDTENDPDDNYVTFYADGIDELCQINTDNIADFVITDFHGFSDEI